MGINVLGHKKLEALPQQVKMQAFWRYSRFHCITLQSGFYAQ